MGSGPFAGSRLLKVLSKRATSLKASVAYQFFKVNSKQKEYFRKHLCIYFLSSKIPFSMSGCITGFRRALWEGWGWDHLYIGMLLTEMPAGSPYSLQKLLKAVCRFAYTTDRSYIPFPFFLSSPLSSCSLPTFSFAVFFKLIPMWPFIPWCYYVYIIKSETSTTSQGDKAWISSYSLVQLSFPKQTFSLWHRSACIVQHLPLHP